MNWRDFWNGTHSIYVNERHRTLHYDRIAKDIAALVGSREDCILDYGCGDAESADALARHCGLLYLFDAAPNVQERLRLRFGRDEKIVVLSASALDAMADHGLDLFVCNSVLQYLSHAEFEAMLDMARRKLKPSGRLIVADVIPPDASAIDDVRALLGFAWRGGFLLPAFAGLIATFFSDYRRLRDTLGLTRYAQQDIETLFAAHGFKVQRAATNIGHNQNRMMFVATPA